jgi:hypothetical protein
MKTVRWIGITLLFFLAVSAIIGSIPLMADPHGSPWSMPQRLLEYSPFASFLIPGILLFVANGMLAAWALWLALARIPRYGLWTVLQGCVLLGWIAAECLLLRVVVWPHYLYGLVAIGLITAGLLLRRDEMRTGTFGNGI